MKFNGLYTALLTPTIIDKEINRSALEKLVDHSLENRVDGLVALGGTGEYCALSNEQRVEVIKSVLEINKGRVPVIAGILSPGLHDSISIAKEFKEIGVDAIMLVSPYYVTPSQQGFIDYYLQFLSEVNLPLVLYNIPYRTNVNIYPETIAKLLDLDSKRQIIGIKECVTSIGQVNQLMSLIKDRIAFICGEESLFFTEILSGAEGAILATSNIIPKIWKKLMDTIRKGDVQKAREMNMKITPFLNLVFSEANPGPLKDAMRLIGIDCGDALLPLKAPSKKLHDSIEMELEGLLKWSSEL